MMQVHEARYYIDRAFVLGRPDQFQSLDGILEFLVYFRGALNSYAKCFVSAGTGRMRLDESRIFGTDANRMTQHARLMELRHKYAAHCDSNEFESASISEQESTSELALRLQYQFSFPFDRLYELRDLISRLETYVVDHQARHVAGIGRQIGKHVRIVEGHEALVGS